MAKTPYKKALSLRKEMTKAEVILWKALRNEQLGTKFRRQHPIGPYIVDFYSYRHYLVIEIDGATHCTDEEIATDLVRTRYLTGLGFQVLRFSNQDIYENLNGVVQKIIEVIGVSPP